MEKKKKSTRFVRRIVQIAAFVLVSVIAVGGYLAEKGIAIPLVPDASLHSICPFGGVVTIYQFAATGGFCPEDPQLGIYPDASRFARRLALRTNLLRVYLPARVLAGVGR